MDLARHLLHTTLESSRTKGLDPWLLYADWHVGSDPGLTQAWTQILRLQDPCTRLHTCLNIWRAITHNGYNMPSVFYGCHMTEKMDIICCVWPNTWRPRILTSLVFQNENVQWESKAALCQNVLIRHSLPLRFA